MRPRSRHRALVRIRRRLRRAGLEQVIATPRRESVLLVGSVSSWEQKVNAGYLAAQLGFKGVVNHIEAVGVVEPQMRIPVSRDRSLDGRSFDVVIIGAGVVGCATARELTRLDLSVAVVEKEDDVATQTSGRNDGMIHPGMAPRPGSLKAHYNVRGNAMYTKASEELGFAFRRVGSLVLFGKRWYRLLVPIIRRRCKKNAVAGPVRFLSRRRVTRMESAATEKQHGAIYLPSTGVVSPFEVAIRYAQNAIRNGAEFLLNTAVLGMRREGNRVTSIHTNGGTIQATVVVNAAGNFADKIAAMADDEFFSLHPRKGVDAILDKRAGSDQHHVLGMPSFLSKGSAHSKGGGLVPCIDGNLLAGPTAREVPGREEFATSAEELAELHEHIALNRSTSPDDIITYFAGIRPATYDEDFVIEASTEVENLIHLAGIQSPGLASAPAIAVDAAGMVRAALAKTRAVQPNPTFTPHNPRQIRPNELSDDERSKLIAKDPVYGRIVCRCEEISEGEVRDALAAPLSVASVDAIKRRTRAGTGRCHSGFCLPAIVQIIARERGIPVPMVSKKGEGSPILLGDPRPHHEKVS